MKFVKNKWVSLDNKPLLAGLHLAYRPFTQGSLYTALPAIFKPLATRQMVAAH
jgi:hypothetical protein